MYTTGCTQILEKVYRFIFILGGQSLILLSALVLLEPVLRLYTGPATVSVCCQLFIFIPKRVRFSSTYHVPEMLVEGGD